MKGNESENETKVHPKGLPTPNNSTGILSQETTIAAQTSESETMSFADKLKLNPDLQVAVSTESLRVLTDGERLDFIDSIGDAIAAIPEGEKSPKFLSTVRRDTHIIVTADDEFSRDWLMMLLPNTRLWGDEQVKVMLAKNLPKMKKGLLWLPGKKTLEDKEITSRLRKQNPGINMENLRIMSRHHEEHGTRLAVSLDQATFEYMSELEFKPFWSTVRAQFTPIEDVVKRRKEAKTIKTQKQAAKQHGKKDGNLKSKSNTTSTQINAIKRKTSDLVSPPSEGAGHAQGNGTRELRLQRPSKRKKGQTSQPRIKNVNNDAKPRGVQVLGPTLHDFFHNLKVGRPRSASQGSTPTGPILNPSEPLKPPDGRKQKPPDATGTSHDHIQG